MERGFSDEMIIISLQCFWTKLKILHGRKVWRLGGRPQRLFMALVGDMFSCIMNFVREEIEKK